MLSAPLFWFYCKKQNPTKIKSWSVLEIVWEFLWCDFSRSRCVCLVRKCGTGSLRVRFCHNEGGCSRLTPGWGSFSSASGRRAATAAGIRRRSPHRNPFLQGPAFLEFLLAAFLGVWYVMVKNGPGFISHSSAASTCLDLALGLTWSL